MNVSRLIVALWLALMPLAAHAQANVTLGGLDADPTAPVEVTADTLTVDQTTRRAIYEGNVVIGQGTMRIAAGRVEVIFDQAAGTIQRLVADGGVTFVTDTEQAEAQAADYDIAAGTLLMTGDVLLTQGPSAIASDRMTINLTDGTARMEGRVSTVFAQDN